VQVSFIIPLYNCLPLTQAMLASLRATLPAGLAHELIFVDDGSTDGTRAWLEKLQTDQSVQVVLHERNLGYAAANNHGATLARGDYVALLNNDLVLTPRWLEPMLAVHRALGTRAGLVSNLHYDAATGALDHAGISINHQGKPEHIRSIPPARRLSSFIRGYRLEPAVTGACVILRREVWRQLGGFDEAFVNGCEDVDLCLRARAAGLANAVAFRSAIRHHVSSSPGRKLRDEANTRQLVLRWREELIALGARAWCRHHLEEHLRDPRDFPDQPSARQALFYALHLRRTAPSAALTGVAANIEIELARWTELLA
jgi:O-antigen biosynthesis protein